MNYADHGYLRLAAVVPSIALANPQRNAERILVKYQLLPGTGCAVVLTPELSLTGYTCEDLFLTEDLQRESIRTVVELANSKGPTMLVVDTGDISELALGWCTYKADRMSRYNVIASVPKTPLRYLVRWYATYRANASLAETLNRVLDTPITPELLPTVDGNISRCTKELFGSFELYAFFLFYFLRAGADIAKIYILAHQAFAGQDDEQELKRWILAFLTRFHQQQFKRLATPPGPKIGTVSLSPCDDWLMPDEADWDQILESINALD